MFKKNISIQFENVENSSQSSDKDLDENKSLEACHDDTVANNEESMRAKILALEAELLNLNVKLVETHDRLLRTAAEADNVRKRLEREKSDTRIYAIQEFAKDLLPVIDAFDKTMTSISSSELNFESEEGKKVSAVIEGVQMISKIFLDTAKKHGIERLPGKDTPFNPSFHNAIAKVTDQNLTQETIIDEFIAGYKIGDRILRTAMVRVGSPD